MTYDRRFTAMPKLSPIILQKRKDAKLIKQRIQDAESFAKDSNASPELTKWIKEQWALELKIELFKKHHEDFIAEYVQGGSRRKPERTPWEHDLFSAKQALNFHLKDIPK